MSLLPYLRKYRSLCEWQERMELVSNRTASIGQSARLLGVLSDATDEQMKNLLGNEDVLQLLLTSNLRGVDREALKAVLHHDPLDRFNDKVLSVFDWLARLRHYNVTYWDNRLTDEQFAQAEAQLTAVPDDHEQRVRGAFFFHVQFDSFAETVEMWMKVFKGELPNSELWKSLKFDEEHFRLHELAETYEPNTIALVHVNLVSYWEPEDGRTIKDDVRPQATEAGEKLAQLELLSFWGVCTDLLMEQNGTDLPYTDMAGTEVTVPGHDAWRACLYVRWGRDFREAWVDASGVDYRSYDWSAPVVRRVRN